MDFLSRIKRLVLRRDVVFTLKAQEEMAVDELTKEDVYEAILNAHRIDKVLRSRSALRSFSGEKLYVIKGLTFDNVLIYTKGKIVREMDFESFYVLISSKLSM